MSESPNKPKPVLIVVMVILSALSLCISVPLLTSLRKAREGERVVFERLESAIARQLDYASARLNEGDLATARHALRDAEVSLPVLQADILTERQDDREALAARVAALRERHAALRAKAAGR